MEAAIRAPYGTASFPEKIKRKKRRLKVILYKKQRVGRGGFKRGNNESERVWVYKEKNKVCIKKNLTQRVWKQTVAEN
jgi:hypothetical protein